MKDELKVKKFFELFEDMIQLVKQGRPEKALAPPELVMMNFMTISYSVIFKAMTEKDDDKLVDILEAMYLMEETYGKTKHGIEMMALAAAIRSNIKNKP
jgi:hypothetical protein